MLKIIKNMSTVYKSFILNKKTQFFDAFSHFITSLLSIKVKMRFLVPEFVKMRF